MRFEQIRDVIVETLNCDCKRVTPQARLREELGADSLAAVELCMALEEACGVVIDDALLPNLETVQDILDYWNQYTE
ncbi:MAG: acyl carrier protein [Oscillospiraceae bacterium]|nr:acyl carrier protein [Oscillospiraceae bacterium]